MAILTCPNCGIGVQPEDLICFRCGANLPHAPYPDDDIPSPTVSQQYIRPGDSGARRRPSLVLLRIAFPTGNVDVPAGTSVILGRDPAQSLVAAAFAQYDNVSRKHATVVVDDSGRATIPSTTSRQSLNPATCCRLNSSDGGATSFMNGVFEIIPRENSRASACFPITRCAAYVSVSPGP